MNVLGLMREAGFKMGGGLLCFQHELEKFAELVRAEALEEAAKVCDANYYADAAGGAIRRLK